MIDHQPRVVVIGGGTGNFTILSALKKHPVSLTALVNMVDNGGSTGLLRDELGVLPPGDIRQCLVALSGASEELRTLFNFRFPPESSFGGHSFGNLFLSAVELMSHDFGEAVRVASDVLRIKGRVLPMTIDDCHLVMHLGGRDVVSEHDIEMTELKPRSFPDFSLTPGATITPEAREAIAEADCIVIAPGDLYTSIIPALLVDGVSDAMQQSKAPLLYVANLVNKANHTRDYTVQDYTDQIERYIGQNRLNYVLYNADLPSKERLYNYAAVNEFPVIINEPALRARSFKAVPGKFVSKGVPVRDANDTLLARSYIRHDGPSIGKAILEIISQL